MSAAEIMWELTERGKASARDAAMPAVPAAAAAAKDPQALEALLAADFVDRAGYHVGAQVIPKGSPAEAPYQSFLEAQRAIGGTGRQLEVLRDVREGKLPADKLPEGHLTAAELLKCATLDANGAMHIGTAVIDAKLVPSFTETLRTEGGRDPQLVASVVKLGLDPLPHTLGPANVGPGARGIKEAAAVLTADPAAREVLAGVPDRLYGDLAAKDLSRTNERLTDDSHVYALTGPNGKSVARGAGTYLAGTVQSVTSQDGVTTVGFATRGGVEQLSYREPLAVDQLGRSVHNPLASTFEHIQAGDSFKLQVGKDGQSLASQVVGMDGHTTSKQLGDIAPPWDRGRSATLGPSL